VGGVVPFSNWLPNRIVKRRIVISESDVNIVAQPAPNFGIS